MEEAYWVVTVDRKTGECRSVLVDNADMAHEMADNLGSWPNTYATVVGKR